MNRKIKRIIAVTLTISALCTVQFTPITINNNFGITKAYADSSDVYLKAIYLSNGEINFSKTKNTYDAHVANTVSEIRISAVPDCLESHSEDYEIDINGYTVHKEDHFNKSIDLDYGENEVKITIVKKKEHSDDETIKRTYTLYITRGSGNVDNEENRPDDIYLDALRVRDAGFTFEKKQTVYNLNVDSSISSTTIKAKPEFVDSTVEIDGTAVDDKDNYLKEVQLKDGKNTFKVNVEDDDNLRTYTLNINRGTQKASASSTSNESTVNSGTNASNANNQSTEKKCNQWVKDNGVWKYNDIAGNFVKNTWFYDENYRNTYYLQGDGSMATGWLPKDGQWYYLDESGAKQTGWKLVGGKWYYLNESGIMQKSTTIGRYKLGSDGAWINN